MKKLRITTEQFDAKLLQILDGMTAAQLITIPGIYEIVAEELNNEVIDAIQDDRENMAIKVYQ